MARHEKSRKNLVELNEIEKHQTLKQKSQESLTGIIEKDVTHATTAKNKDIIPTLYFSLAKYAIKQNYASVATLKLT